MAVVVHYPGPGCIVEYMEGNLPQIGMVMEEQGGRVRLLLPNRRETRITMGRLLPWAGPATTVHTAGREEAVRLLENHRARREALEARLDAVELWETVQGEVDRASAKWFAELFEDEPDVDSVAAYGHVLLACKTHFKFQPPEFEVWPAAVVEARLAGQEAARQREKLAGSGNVFFRLLWDVFRRKRRLPPAASAEWPDTAVQEILSALLLRRIAEPERHEDEELWRTLSKGLPDMQYMPLHLAEAWGLVPPHYNFWLDRADYSPGDTWAEDHAAAVEAVAEAVAGHDTTTLELPFLSIDSRTTRDIDDAFHIAELPGGAWRLTLALAAPAAFWPFDSALDRAVRHRATSIYLPEAVHHMLPECLGTDILSLVAGQLRPAFCLHCDIAADGTLITVSPSLEWVRLAANLCYEDCEAALRGEESAATPYVEQLRLGDRLATLRQAVRIAAGAVIMDRPDPKVHLEGEGEELMVSLEEAVPTPRAQNIVAEMMILASAATAAWAGERGIPLLYRTQDIAIPREYAGVWTQPQDMARIMRTLTPAQLESQPRPHAALGVPAYSPVTSPLRRYPDLVNEAQILSWLRDGRPRLDAAAMTSLLSSLQGYLEAAGQVQRFRPRYWKLLYIRQRGDKCWWDAVITDENDAFAFVTLPKEQLFVRGRRSLFGERAHAGQAVSVRLGKVNPLYNEIHLLEVMDQ